MRDEMKVVIVRCNFYRVGEGGGGRSRRNGMGGSMLSVTEVGIGRGEKSVDVKRGDSFRMRYVLYSPVP